MRKNYKAVVKKGLALLMAAVTVMCGIPGVDVQAERISTTWNLYNNGSSNSITNTVCELENILHTRHYMQASEIESPDIEAYVKISGVNVKLWDIAREQYVNFYGLESTSTVQCFSVAYRSSAISGEDSRFYVDGTHVTNRYTMQGVIWFNRV